MGRNRPILAPELMSTEPPPGDEDEFENTVAEGPSQPENDVQMSFFDHLDELRTRLIRSTYVFLPAVAVAWIYRVPLLDFLAIPLGRAIHKLQLPTNGLHFLSPADAFVVYMKLALFVGFLASSPWVFWQAWAFVSPGLYAKEKRFAIPFVLFSTLCFLGGAVFGYYAVFPSAFETFLGFSEMLPMAGVRITPSITMSEYLDFTTQMLLAFGVVFEVPVVVTFLAITGIVDWKQLLAFGRWFIVIAAVIAAVLTPPDVGSQITMLVPLIVLYYFSVLLAFLFGKKRAPAS
jgi:sec-independent protein translocase protein TatC